MNDSLFNKVEKKTNIKKESILDRKSFCENHTSPLKEYCGLLVDEGFSVTKLGVE